MIKNKVKHILNKKFYSKNFFFYGDSGTNKTTIVQKLSKALANSTPICYKSKDRKYINKYENQVLKLVEEFNWDLFCFGDLMNICESDIPIILRKNKIAIKVVSK